MVSKTTDNFLEAFSSHLEQFSRPNHHEREQIRNGPIRLRRLDSLARLIVREKTENCAAVALVDNQWHFTANNLEEITGNVRMIYSGLTRVTRNKRGEVLKTKDARHFLFEKYLKSFQSHTRTRTRLEKDIRKFLSSLKHGKGIFTTKEISNLFRKKIFIENPEKLHAEVSLITFFEKEKCTIYLGISKLCCRLCAATIFAFRKSTHLNIKVRGRHGNFYFAWKPPSELFEKTLFRKFVGEKAFSIYKHAGSNKQVEINNILLNLDDNREVLKPYFTAQRGGVKVDSVSAAPPSTEDSESSKESDTISELPSEEADDSDSDVEKKSKYAKH
jgi:hypothetical protein